MASGCVSGFSKWTQRPTPATARRGKEATTPNAQLRRPLLEDHNIHQISQASIEDKAHKIGNDRTEPTSNWTYLFSVDPGASNAMNAIAAGPAETTAQKPHTTEIIRG